jgi:hypothetical protein
MYGNRAEGKPDPVSHDSGFTPWFRTRNARRFFGETTTTVLVKAPASGAVKTLFAHSRTSAFIQNLFQQIRSINKPSTHN